MNWKKRYEKLQIGDKIICIKTQSGAAEPGTEGIVRGINGNGDKYSLAQVEVTKIVGNPDLHNCDGLFDKSIGYNFRLFRIKKLNHRNAM